MKHRFSDTVTLARLVEVEADSEAGAWDKLDAGEFVVLNEEQIDNTPWEYEGPAEGLGLPVGSEPHAPPGSTGSAHYVRRRRSPGRTLLGVRWR